MTDQTKIAETVTLLRTWKGDIATIDEAADFLEALAAENAALKAERDTQKHDANKWFSLALDNRHKLEAAEAERDRLAAELAEARELVIKMGDDLLAKGDTQ